MDIASIIDHTLLKQDCDFKAIKNLCEEAKTHHFAAVCIPPFHVARATDLLRESEVKVATVIGFPMGYSATPAKVEEIKKAIDDGADEVDVVVNLCAVKSGNWSYVQNDIDSMSTTARLKGKVIKVILETALLEQSEILKLCEICEQVQPNFVKTSTGFGGGGATVEVVELLRSNLSKEIKIKASGGIRKAKDAEKMIAAGADRLGTSSGLAIVTKNN